MAQEKTSFAQLARSMSAQEIAQRNRLSIRRARLEHADFQTNFHSGKCYLCGAALNSFDRENPCIHWLLKPPGFTKWNFIAVFDRFDLFQIQMFLRWVANEEVMAKNINDLAVEGTGKIVEITIRYLDFEWAFSCGDGDYAGHAGASGAAARPHYHFQMRHKRQAFIRYNDFHIPLSHSDIERIASTRASPELLKDVFVGGEGMGDLITEDLADSLLSSMRSTDDEDQAMFKLSSVIRADEGTTISGDDIADIVAEAKETGVTITSLLRTLKNVKVQTIVTAAPSVVEQAPRSGRKKRLDGLQ